MADRKRARKDEEPTVSADGAPNVKADDFGLPERYEIVRAIGTGGMGAVYLVHDRTLDRQVAIKLLSETYSQDPALVARFQTEARAVARLNHPDVVHVYDFGRAGSRYFIAMEYVDGGSFAGELARRGTFGERETIAVARKACAALAVVHAAGIVHRDVKPENMMRTSKGEFKLVDMGLAKVVDEAGSMTMTGVAMGTPYYISPEQIRGERDIDLRTDVYSLGATMYQFATGHFPFEGTSAAHVMSRHLRDPLPDPRLLAPSLSAGFCGVVAKMMAKQAADRHRDMHEVDVDLALVEKGGAPAPPPRAPEARRVWDRTDLDPIEAALLKTVGPMARVLVAKASGACATREQMIESLAREVTNAAARKSFLDECSRGAVHRPKEAAPAASAAVTVPPIAVDPAVLAKLTTLLTSRIGPVAGVIARRSAARTPGLAALVADLAEHIPPGPARDEFVAAARAVTKT